MQKIAIVVPCYNESNRLAKEEFLQFVQETDVVSFIFVDDGSQDQTREIVRQMCDAAPGRISSVILPKNKGKAEAVRQGFLKAFAAKYQAIGYWDADLATPLQEIHTFNALLDSDQIDMVLGARVRLLRRNVQRNPAKHYMGRVFATVVSMVLGLTIYDSQCGAKLFKNTKELQRVFAEQFVSRWIFDVEILARFIALRRKNCSPSVNDTACEHPLPEWRDVPGSKIKLKDYCIAIYELALVAVQMKGNQ